MSIGPCRWLSCSATSREPQRSCRENAKQIQGLTALDRYTLQMVLEEPLASALAVLGLAHAAVVPQEEVERLGERFGRTPVGTGPFTFVRWEPSQEIVLAANEHYHEGRPFLDAIVFKNPRR